MLRTMFASCCKLLKIDNRTFDCDVFRVGTRYVLEEPLRKMTRMSRLMPLAKVQVTAVV